MSVRAVQVGVMLAAALMGSRAGATPFTPVIGRVDGGYFVAWLNVGAANTTDVVGIQLDPQGRPRGRRIALTSGTGGRSALALACASTRCLAVWDHQDAASAGVVSVRGALVDMAATRAVTSVVIDAAGGTQRDPAIASDGVNFAVVWTDMRATYGDLYAAYVSGADGHVSQRTPVTVAPGSQTDASIAWDGSQFELVWDDARSGDGDIYLAHLPRTGPPPAPIAGAPLVSGANAHSARVACETSRCSVVWRQAVGAGESREIERAGIRETVTVRPSALMAGVLDVARGALRGAAVRVWALESPRMDTLRVVVSPASTVVAWDEAPMDAPAPRHAYVARLAADGGLRDTTAVALAGASDSSAPGLALRADGAQAVWVSGNVSGSRLLTAAVRGTSPPAVGVPITVE